MPDGLRTWVLSTLGGWLVACALVYLGERGALPPPPLAAVAWLTDDVLPHTAAPRSPAGDATEVAVAAPGAGGRDPRADLAPPRGEPAGAGAADEVRPPRPPALVVAEPAGANLRAAPAMSSPVIAVLPRGTVVEPEPPGAPDEAVGPGWQHVAWNGRAGWVADSLLQPATDGR
ncbi:MAG TPA: SH3 domain-containing protein [Chloroflexota bacterium]|nr:SH3 domain-containing protein [Chloroflexota bacterium]